MIIKTVFGILIVLVAVSAHAQQFDRICSPSNPCKDVDTMTLSELRTERRNVNANLRDCDVPLNAAYDLLDDGGFDSIDEADNSTKRTINRAIEKNQRCNGIDADGNHLSGGRMERSQRLWEELVRRGDPE